jgi:serine/threonine protein kinase
MTEIKNGSYLYQVGKMVGETGFYRLYLCRSDRTERQCLLQIATSAEQNGELERAAYVLKELKRRAEELEQEYAKVKSEENVMLNYDLGFPELIDSFVCQEQGKRRINILAFKNVAKVGQLVPLTNITNKDHLRVDLRTSAWIMGKLLKLLVFAHSEGIAAGSLSGGNILIEPDQHYVLIFDWSAAQTSAREVPNDLKRQEISQAAQSVVTVLGGDLKTGVFPDDGEEVFGRYTEHILRLAQGKERITERAHAEFYKLVDSLWERKFYPFTTKPLEITEETKEEE